MKKLFLLPLSIFAILLFACSGETEIVEVVKEVPVVREKVVEVEKKFKPLVIYSGRKESLIGPIIQSFTDATKIPVEVKYGKTGEMAATLMEEGET